MRMIRTFALDEWSARVIITSRLYLHNATVNAIEVPWRILGSENERTRYASKTSTSNQGGGAKGSCPLSTDIVRLVGHCAGDIGIDASSDEERAKISHSGGLRPGHDDETDDANHRVHDDQGPADSVFIPSPSARKHEHPGKDIWRCDKAL